MDQIVLRFLQDLAKINQVYPQVYETDFQENILTAILEGYIKAKNTYSLPKSFEMFSTEGDALVHEALDRFLVAANKEAERVKCFDPQARISLVTDVNIPPPKKGGYLTV